MRYLLIVLSFIILSFNINAHAQGYWAGPRTGLVDPSGTPIPSATNPMEVSGAATTGTVAGCTVGTSSAQCLAPNLAIAHIQIQNVSSNATIACTWGGTAIINNSSSFLLAAGQSANWGAATGWVPTRALNCIASASSTPLYIEYY